MLIVLFGLGTWQVYRLQWKNGVLAQIATAEAAPAVPLTQTPPPYTKVSVIGRFRFDRSARFGAEVRDTTVGPTMGTYQVVPLERGDASTILVNRGWVPQQRETPLAEPDGVVAVTGYVRTAETARWFSATDNVAERQFYTLDPGAIAAAVGVVNPAPFTLIALGPAVPATYPAPAQQLPRPPNNHLAYAITWYGLAIALIIIFVVWTRKPSRS